MECKKETNLKNCKCTYQVCPRKGLCCECINYHREKNEIPGCYFSVAGEKSYDRSISAFINDYKKNNTI